MYMPCWGEHSGSWTEKRPSSCCERADHGRHDVDHPQPSKGGRPRHFENRVRVSLKEIRRTRLTVSASFEELQSGRAEQLFDRRGGFGQTERLGVGNSVPTLVRRLSRTRHGRTPSTVKQVVTNDLKTAPCRPGQILLVPSQVGQSEVVDNFKYKILPLCIFQTIQKPANPEMDGGLLRLATRV